MKFNSSFVKNSFQLSLAVAATLLLTTSLILAKGKPPKDDTGGGFISLSVSFEDELIDLAEVGGEFAFPGISSDGFGSYVDGVHYVAAITGDGFRLDTEIHTSEQNPPVRFLSFDLDGDATGDFLATVDMRLDTEYHSDANGNLTDANGIPVAVADRVSKNSRMVPRDMAPNSVARAALFVRYDQVYSDGTFDRWRFVFGDSQPDDSIPESVPVWIFAGEDNGSGQPLNWRIVGTTGAQFELVPDNPNKKNPSRTSTFRGTLNLPVDMLLERLP